jgi:hypothetical protein
VVDLKVDGTLVTVGIPAVVVMVVVEQVVMPRLNEQPVGTVDAGLPPGSALAVPATTAKRAADAARDAAIRTLFKNDSQHARRPDDVVCVPTV